MMCYICSLCTGLKAKWLWKNELMLCCASVCAYVRAWHQHLIDNAEALRLIGSHDDHINRHQRLTFDPENTAHSIDSALSPSPCLHILHFFFVQNSGSEGKKKVHPLISYFFPSLNLFALSSLTTSFCSESR